MNGELWIQSNHGLQKTAMLKVSPLHLYEGCQRGRSNQTMKKATIDSVEDTLGLILESWRGFWEMVRKSTSHIEYGDNHSRKLLAISGSAYIPKCRQQQRKGWGGDSENSQRSVRYWCTILWLLAWIVNFSALHIVASAWVFIELMDIHRIRHLHLFR